MSSLRVILFTSILTKNNDGKLAEEMEKQDRIERIVWSINLSLFYGQIEAETELLLK